MNTSNERADMAAQKMTPPKRRAEQNKAFLFVRNGEERKEGRGVGEEERRESILLSDLERTADTNNKNKNKKKFSRALIFFFLFLTSGRIRIRNPALVLLHQPF